MLITTGKVHDGTIQLDGESLPEGAIVTVLTHEGDETLNSDRNKRLNSSRQSGKPSEVTQSPALSFFSRFGLHERLASGPHCNLV